LIGRPGRAWRHPPTTRLSNEAAAWSGQRAELDALDPQLRETLTDPLAAAGRLRLLDGDTPLRAGRTVATPGHTPGHQSVLVGDGRELVLVTGDLLVHALRGLHSELAYSHEIDPEAAGTRGSACSTTNPLPRCTWRHRT
jgi:glyoxylase-like metal-dependent hydrolase (beta-lactamase superfamily II)